MKIKDPGHNAESWIGILETAPDIESAAERLGQLLDLPGPAPTAAAERVLTNPLFARALFAARKIPAARHWLLTAPADAPNIEEAEQTKAAQSPLKLAGKAASSLLKWGMAGLEHAKPWEIERRLAACQACEFQEDAPDTLVYRGAAIAVGKDAKICSICHCLINTKAALATERCPKRDLNSPDLSLWGEPWEEPAEPNEIWR